MGRLPENEGIDVTFSIKGAERLEKKLGDKEILAKPLKHILSRAALLVVRQAKINAPVDTGRLKSSITHEIDSSPIAMWAKAGTNVVYAASLESSGKRPRGVGKIPYFGPAIDTMKDKLTKLLNEAEAMIEKHWGK